MIWSIKLNGISIRESDKLLKKLLTGMKFKQMKLFLYCLREREKKKETQGDIKGKNKVTYEK